MQDSQLLRKLTYPKSTKFGIDLKLKKYSRSSVVQRAHSNMLSIAIRATAHYGAVTELKATRDGMYLLSSENKEAIKIGKASAAVGPYSLVFAALYDSWKVK